MNMRQKALEWLYRELKKAKIALGNAESRPGVTREELDNLQRKIAVIDWMIPLVIKAQEEE